MYKFLIDGLTNLLQLSHGEFLWSILCTQYGEILVTFFFLLYFRIAAISMASKITDMQLGDSVEISKLITKKEIQQAR